MAAGGDLTLVSATGIAPLAGVGSAAYVQLAITLALLVGVFQALMGVVRLGFLVNFLSHPVLAGFTTAAALVIGFSQLKHLLGIAIPNLEFFELLRYAATHLAETNWVTFALGGGGILILVYFKQFLAGGPAALERPAAVDFAHHQRCAAGDCGAGHGAGVGPTVAQSLLGRATVGEVPDTFCFSGRRRWWTWGYGGSRCHPPLLSVLSGIWRALPWAGARPASGGKR